MDLKSKLSTKGCKHNLQFTTDEQNYFLNKCGFTDEEEMVFLLRCRGRSIVDISFVMEDTYSTYSVGRVEARIRTIKKKIIKVLK